jgi:transposase
MSTSSADSVFRLIHPHAAGIDIGNGAHFVAVPPESCAAGESCVRKFDTFTGELYAIADWLTAHAVDTVALESTGVYWIPLFEVLESRGFKVCLVDTRRLKSVPGRKSDVKDCQWLQQLHTFGLLHSAFRPDDEIGVLRTYLRQREMLIACAADHIQHMQKALQQMNVKLSNVISDITGLTGMTIIQAILNGERDPVKLAKLSDPRCKQPTEVIAKSLVGHWRDDHVFELRQAFELVRTYQQKVVECDSQVEAWLKQLPDRRQDDQPPLSPRKTKQNPHTPRFDARSLLFRAVGVDLTSINGVEASTAMKVIGEIGRDISRWPTVKHFCSWLCLCPGTKKSGGKVLSSRTRRSRNRVATALRMAAQSLERTQTALGAYYRRQKSRLGAPEAITATAHKLARIIYSLMKNGQSYVDVGQEAYEQQYQTRILHSLERRAEKLGFQLVRMPTPA